MKYIAVDFEWNQAQHSKQTKVLDDGKRFSGEIIQVGAVKLSETLEIESVFKSEIKPKIYKKMNSKVSELTGITGEMLENAPGFSDFLTRFIEWCEPDAIFFTWGIDDIRILRQNCSVNGEKSDFFKTWYNLQVFFNMQTDTGTNQKSLASAVEYFNIENTLKAHDALNDAYYTAMIAKRLDIKKGIEEYPGAKCALCGSDKGKTIFSGIKSRRAALSNSQICGPHCPVCDEKFSEIAPFVRANRFKYLSFAKCTNHGEFTVKLRLSDSKEPTKNVTVYRTVRGCKEGDREAYDLLVLKELERKLGKDRKKAEMVGQCETNGGEGNES